MAQHQLSDLLELAQRKVAECDVSSSWVGYAAILRYVNEALQRLPQPGALAACDEEDMERILEAELEHLASAVSEIFPGRGPEELTYYVNKK